MSQVPKPGHDLHGSSCLGSVGKALMVLECVSRHVGPVGVSTVARSTGLPKSTVHRLLSALEANGAVRHAGSMYSLGEMVRRLAETQDDQAAVRLRRIVMPDLVALHDAVRLPTCLSILRDGLVIYLEILYSRGYTRLVLATTDGAPAHCTATGKALLAYDPVAAAEYRSASELRACTSNTITSVDQLDLELRRVRRQGIARNNEEYLIGHQAMAAPVIGDSGRSVAAIGVCGGHEKFNPVVIEPALRRAAHAASLALRDRAPTAHCP